MNHLKTFAATAAMTLLAGTASAVTIDFESDPSGARNDGFQSVDSSIVSFSDTDGSSMAIFDFGSQSDGQGLAVYGDDPSKLQMDFTQSISSIGLDFGNDDSCCVGPGGLAVLEGYFNGVLVGTATVALNRNDIMDQSISFAGGIMDRAVFYYAEANGNAANLTEIVDNITFNVAPVPLPAGMPLLLAGLGGMGLLARRKKNA